jgi:hypothetical protein
MWFSFSFIPEIQDDAESIHQLLLLLSDPSIEVKQNALADLMKLARESSPSLWENQFKDILMSVVEKMKDPEVCLMFINQSALKCLDTKNYYISNMHE